MKISRDKNLHRPRHLYINNQMYFITGRTYNNIKYFITNERKKILCRVIDESAKRNTISIYGWVVLDNHYHLLIGVWDRKFNEFHPNQRFVFNSSNQEDNDNSNAKYRIVGFIKKIHKDSARNINLLDNNKGRMIWYQYWDRIIRTDKNFYSYLNYIHLNPYKHHIIKDISKLDGYKYSSYGQYVLKKGYNWLVDCLENFSISN